MMTIAGGRVVTVVSGGVCGVSEIISPHPHPPRVGLGARKGHKRYQFERKGCTNHEQKGRDYGMAENMNLYRSEADKQLGVVCAVAMTAYNIDATEASKLLRALVVLGHTSVGVIRGLRLVLPDRVVPHQPRAHERHH